MAHPVKVEEGDMELFVTKLKLDLPANIKLHNMAVNVLSGRWHYSEFWVDRWPDFNGAIAVPSKAANSSFRGVYLLCGNEMSAKFLLKHCVKWDPPLEFHGIHDHLYPAVVEAATSNNAIEAICCDYEVFGVSDNQANTTNRPVLMGGYTTKSLCLEHLPYIVKNWADATLFKNPTQFLETILSCFPTVGIFDCHGYLAGYAGLYHYGGVAFLSVSEGHRRKGIGKFLLSRMLELASQSDRIPHTNVARGNVAALELHRAAGLLKVTSKCERFVFYKS